MLKTGKKETKDPRLQNNTTYSSDCQEKTLVSDNAIFENMNHFKVYSHCVQFKKRYTLPKRSPRERKTRGSISKFSKKARFRLFELLSMIDNNLDFPPLFVTLTYHYGHLNNKKSTKSELHNFLVQLRNYDPDVQFIWRIELQKRGAPHYHLLIFPGQGESKCAREHYISIVRHIWHEIADPNSKAHGKYGCLIKTVRSYREACIYLSKYIAKVPEGLDDIEVGKHWGNSRKLPVKMKKRIGMWDDEAKIIIRKILKWMRENGKAKYANEEFLNIHGDFTVFIDEKDFLDLCNEKEYFFRNY